MKAILIDDEPNSSRNLERKLTMVCPEVDVIASCTNVTESVEAIRTFQPDLIFLDMDLGAEEGFEVLDHTQEFNFETIIVTMHSGYAKEAFKYQVTHFLTKPVQKEQLREAVERIIQNRHSNVEHQIQLLQDKIGRLHRIGIRLAEEPEIIFCSIDQISYCESNGSRTKVHFIDGRSYLANGNLGNFTSVLEGQHFVRIHHQYLINLLHLERYQRVTHNVMMRGEKRPLSVSNSYKGKLIIKIREMTIR